MTKKPDVSPTPKKKKDPNERIRMVGEREQAIEIPLTADQLDDERSAVMEFLDHKEEIEDRKKEAMKNFASQIATVELQIEGSRRLIKSKRRKVVVVIEEWLTAANEIIQVRRDTNEQIGDPRRARAEELQERLFPPEQEDPQQQNAAQSSNSTPTMSQEAEFPSSEDAFGAPAG